MRSLTYSAGEIIFRQGDPAETMYDIQDGSVGIYLDYGTEQEDQIAVLERGRLFGEMGVIESQPRSATAVALDNGCCLCEIGEAELTEYLRDKPDQLLRIMLQLSARTREMTEKYFSACQALSEHEEAEKNGTKKSESLNQQLEQISETAQKMPFYYASVASSFYKYVQEDLAETEGKRDLVKVSLVERLTVRQIPPKEMHANPDDEFSQPEIGPSDRIIEDYMEMILNLQRCHEDIFDEPVIVNKMLQGGYLILNGHHRWAAAMKFGLRKIRASIVNPPH